MQQMAVVVNIGDYEIYHQIQIPIIKYMKQ